MVVTEEVDLPTFETLTVPEINVSTSTLMAAAPYLGKRCEDINNEFMLCRQETRDARACLDLGKKVTACAFQLLRDIKNKCLQEFNQYANCVDKSSGDYGYTHCRNTQEIFDRCMCEKLCMTRPDFGYFTRGKIHRTNRAGPPETPCPCQPEIDKATPSLPDSKERYPPRFGGRLFWTTE